MPEHVEGDGATEGQGFFHGKSWTVKETPQFDFTTAATDAMRAVFGLSARDVRFAVVELALLALADNGTLEASSREMENFEALAADDPESLLAAVNAAIRQEGQSLRLPNPPTTESLREWADQLVGLVISPYPSDELPVPL